MKRKLIAIAALGLLSAQAGVALADNTDVFADPYWTSLSSTRNSTPMFQGTALHAEAPKGKYDLVDNYNP